MRRISYLLAIVFIPAALLAQVGMSGQMAIDLFKSAQTRSPRVINAGRPTFDLVGDLFLDGYVNDHVTALTNVKLSDDGYISFDYLAVRLSNLTPIGLNIQAGKFDLPFGNLAERRFPRNNPLFSLPLIYEYRTGLPSYIPTGAEILTNRGEGSGMRLLDGGMYDFGLMLFGSTGILDYSLAVSNGTISTTGYGTLNTNHDFGKILRLAITPTTGLTIGVAYTIGAYLDEPSTPPPRSIDVNSYAQSAAEVDMEFSLGHLVVDGEGVWSTWRVPLDTQDENFKALGFYLEGKYTLIPRLFVAARVSGLHFGDALLSNAVQPWDYDVTEWEGGFGYFLDKDILVKLVRRETRIHGGSMPKDNLTVLQLAVAY